MSSMTREVGKPHAVVELDAMDHKLLRLLSEDPDSGSATYMARLPAGWRATEPAQDTTLELFVMGVARDAAAKTQLLSGPAAPAPARR